MTRTPTTFVTAIAIAARVRRRFPSGAHFPGFCSGRRCATLAGVPAGSAGIGIGFSAFRFSPVAIDRPRF
jgi:hypothetical protein